MPGSQSAAVQAMPVLPPLACDEAKAASRSIRTVLRPGEGAGARDAAAYHSAAYHCDVVNASHFSH